MKEAYNIILADDHTMFVDGLKSILVDEDQLRIVLTASSGDQVIKYLRNNKEERIDLVITDLNMPGMDGVALNKIIKEEFPTIKTLVVSMLEDVKKIKILTDAQVNGYISKNAEKQELLTAIKDILKGENYFSQRIKQVAMDAMFAAKSAAQVNLTNRERDVLKLIAQEFTTNEIADMLFLSKHTIESYRKNLISKLEVRNLAGLTRYAIENGLLD